MQVARTLADAALQKAIPRKGLRETYFRSPLRSGAPSRIRSSPRESRSPLPVFNTAVSWNFAAAGEAPRIWLRCRAARIGGRVGEGNTIEYPWSFGHEISRPGGTYRPVMAAPRQGDVADGDQAHQPGRSAEPGGGSLLGAAEQLGGGHEAQLSPDAQPEIRMEHLRCSDRVRTHSPDVELHHAVVVDFQSGVTPLPTRCGLAESGSRQQDLQQKTPMHVMNEALGPEGGKGGDLSQGAGRASTRKNFLSWAACGAVKR